MGNPAEQLWENVHDSYYWAYFNELISELLERRWHMLQYSTAILVGMTASGSAVAGWSLWSDAGWKETWMLLAGTAALASIVHGALVVPTKLAHHARIRGEFSALRIQLETLRTRLQGRYAPEMEEEYEKLRSRVLEIEPQAGTGLLASESLGDQIQIKLDKLLERKGFV